MKPTNLFFWFVANLFVTALLLIGVSEAEAQFRSGACHAGAAWNSNADRNGFGSAFLLPCEEEEPATTIALSCKKGSNDIDVQLDYLGPNDRSKVEAQILIE